MLCAEFPQVQYINLSEIVNVLKVVAIMYSQTSPHRHLYNMDSSLLRTVCLVPEMPKIIHSLRL